MVINAYGIFYSFTVYQILIQAKIDMGTSRVIRQAGVAGVQGEG